MKNLDNSKNVQPRFPEIYVSEKTPKTFLALVRWHILLHSSWGNPLSLGHWPTDDAYNAPMVHWLETEDLPASFADILLNEQEPYLISIRALANLMLTGVDAMREQVELHGLPYHRTERFGKLAWDVELYPSLKILLTLPSTQGRALTRHRAGWAVLAIKAGLWDDLTGYLLSPDDEQMYEEGCLARLFTCNHLPPGDLKREALRLNKIKLNTIAYRRFKRQHKLFKKIYGLERFETIRFNSELWREAVQEGEA